ALGKQVIERYKAGTWDADWCIVDTIVRAGSATIVISSSKQASLGLTATSAIELANLARLDAGVRVSAQEGDVLHFVAAKGLVPLFKLARIKQSLLSKVFGGALTFGGASAPREESAAVDVDDEEALEAVTM